MTGAAFAPWAGGHGGYSNIEGGAAALGEAESEHRNARGGNSNGEPSSGWYLTGGSAAQAAEGSAAAAIGGVLAFRLAGLAATFVASVVAARALGPAVRGELAVMLAVPSLLAAFTLMGLDSSNLYFAGRSPKAHSRAVRYSVAYAAVAGSGVAAGGLFLSGSLPALRLGLPLSALVASIALTPFVLAGALLGAAESGRGRPGRAALATAAMAWAFVVLMSLLAIAGLADAFLFFTAFALSQLGLAGYLILVSAVPTVASEPRSPSGGALSIRGYFTFGLQANVSALAMLLLLRVDVPLIQLLSGPREVGLYATAVPVTEALLLVPTAATLVVLPRAAQAVMDAEQALRVVRVTLLLTSVAAIALAIAAPIVIPTLFGEEFAPAVPLVWVLLPGLVLLGTSRVLHVFLLARRRFAPVTFSAVAALTVCLALDLVLIPPLGALGAALASSIAYAVFALIVAFAAGAVTTVPWRENVLPTAATVRQLTKLSQNTLRNRRARRRSN